MQGAALPGVRGRVERCSTQGGGLASDLGFPARKERDLVAPAAVSGGDEGDGCAGGRVAATAAGGILMLMCEMYECRTHFGKICYAGGHVWREYVSLPGLAVLGSGCLTGCRAIGHGGRRNVSGYGSRANLCRRTLARRAPARRAVVVPRPDRAAVVLP